MTQENREEEVSDVEMDFWDEDDGEELEIGFLFWFLVRGWMEMRLGFLF